MKILLYCGCALLLVTGCRSTQGDFVSGSGRVITERRDVKEFSKIKIGGSSDAEIEVGPEVLVNVTTDDNIQPLVETKVEGDTLYIRTHKSYRTSSGVKVQVKVPELETLTITGSSSVKARGLRGDEHEFYISGSGNGVLQGAVDEAKYRISGSGSVDAGQLIAKRVEADVSGSGNMLVNAVESLEANVSGSGKVKYRGHPNEVEKRVSGSGTVQAE